MNETEIEEGDNILTVFYRNNSIEPGKEIALDDLKLLHFS